MKARVAAHRQITALPATAPDAVRTRFARLSGGELINALARTRPAPATDTPASATARALRRLARRHRIPGRRDRRHRHRAARTDRPRRPDDARHQGAAPSTTATLLVTAGDNPGRIRTEASFAALCGAAPIPAGPGRTNRHRLNRGGDRQANRAPHPNAPPARRPAHQGLRRPPHRHGQELQRDTALPQTRHRPRSMAPADPPPTRTPHRRPAPTAPRTRTHPHPSRPPPEHPPGPDQRTRTRHTPRHHPHRSIPPMAQHPTTTDPHRLTPIGASASVLGSAGEGVRGSGGGPGAHLDNPAGPGARPDDPSGPAGAQPGEDLGARAGPGGLAVPGSRRDAPDSPRARRFPVERAPPICAFDWKPTRSRRTTGRSPANRPQNESFSSGCGSGAGDRRGGDGAA